MDDQIKLLGNRLVVTGMMSSMRENPERIKGWKLERRSDLSDKIIIAWQNMKRLR